MPNNLREYRLKYGLRLIDVSKQLGFTDCDRLSYWERGMRFPNVINLIKLCKLYNVFPHDLLGDTYTEIIGNREENMKKLYMKFK